MPVSLSIKNVPEPVVARLKERARRHHRSLQGELVAILEETVTGRKLSVEEVSRRLRALKFRTPDQSTALIREDRDRR